MNIEVVYLILNCKTKAQIEDVHRKYNLILTDEEPLGQHVNLVYQNEEYINCVSVPQSVWPTEHSSKAPMKALNTYNSMIIKAPMQMMQYAMSMMFGTR